MSLANRHPRVNILSPGVGVGGHCISVDPWFLVDAAPADSAVIKTARHTNDLQPKLLATKLSELVVKKGFKRIVCLGVSYKPNSDDLREYPALNFISELINMVAGIEILVCDPNVLPQNLPLRIRGIFKTGIPSEAFHDSDLVVHLVDHDEFNSFDFGESSHIQVSGTGQVNLWQKEQGL